MAGSKSEGKGEQGVGNPAEGCANKKKSGPPNKPVPPMPKDFINFKIVDEKGDPVQGVFVMIEDSGVGDNKKIDEKPSDENGLVKFKNIKPGECKVQFIWEGLKIEDVVLLKD